MGNLIDKVRIKQGRLVRVWNQDRVFGSSAEYVAVWVENSKGSEEECLLFTEKEIQTARERASKNIEDLTEKGFITDLID
jgi:hypothetical protein